ncbi:MAG: sulfite exporter TauE/SafE family protein [Desulfurococcales archaeon]|nr:sulfite exporter TauE/SafE family protein [Desulfurococcales archaeon]
MSSETIESTTILMALVAGLIAGVSLGLTGGGGSILGVPLLVYLAGLPPHLAIGTSLVAVGVTALLSSLKYFAEGYVNVTIALLMAPLGFLGVYLGSLANKLFPGDTLLLVFSGFMMIVGAGMIRDALNSARRAMRGAAARRGRGKRGVPRALIAGLGVGFLSGFLGVGGGFIIVPTLVWFLGLTMKEAVGTSLLIIFFNGLSGLASYTLQGRPLELSVTGVFVVGGALGGYLGARLASRLSDRALRIAFAALVYVIAIYIIARSL